MGLIGDPDGFQAGADFRGRPVRKSDPLAASEDARDGKLSGSSYFLGSADAGLERKISGPESQVTVLISAGKSATEAVAIIEQARFLGEDLLRKKAITQWQSRAKRVNLPEQATPSEIRVARRNILNLFVGRDRESGAIVASPPASRPIILTGPGTARFMIFPWTWPAFRKSPDRIWIFTAEPSAGKTGPRALIGFWEANPYFIPRGDIGIPTFTPTALRAG